MDGTLQSVYKNAVFGHRMNQLTCLRLLRTKGSPARRLLRQMERISQLPRTQQCFVMQMLDAVFAQAGR